MSNPILGATNLAGKGSGLFQAIDGGMNLLFKTINVDATLTLSDNGTTITLGIPVGATKGSATIIVGNMSVTVNHGLNAVPAAVLFAPKGFLTGGGQWAVTAANATQFTLSISVAQAAAVSAYWRAQL